MLNNPIAGREKSQYVQSRRLFVFRQGPPVPEVVWKIK